MRRPAKCRPERVGVLAEEVRLQLVEDSALWRREVQGWLSSTFPDWRVLASASGEEALVDAAEFRPHLVLMNLRLPGMSGVEATRRFKQEQPAARVVVLTLYGDSESRRQGLAAGAEDLVLKSELVTKLRPVLEKAAAAVADRPMELPRGTAG